MEFFANRNGDIPSHALILIGDASDTVVRATIKESISRSQKKKPCLTREDFLDLIETKSDTKVKGEIWKHAVGFRVLSCGKDSCEVDVYDNGNFKVKLVDIENPSTWIDLFRIVRITDSYRFEIS